jgi:type IV pilus assembly protein PilM
LALFKKKDFVLGIDIGPSAVKLIELSRSGQRYRVEAMALEPLPEGSMEDRNPIDLEQSGAAVKRALKASGSRLKKAAAAVPTSSVIIRTIPMPLEFGEDEIEANIQLDASQYIPFPLEEIYLDFQVVPGSTKAAAGTQEVMLVASRQENVELRKDVLQEAGLQTVIVDVEAYALENTFRLLPQELFPRGVEGDGTPSGKHARRIALVDIGTTITTLYVMQEDKVIFTREQNFGGEQLTLAVAEAYGLSREKAELAKKHPGELPGDYTTRVLDAFQKAAAEQINQALQFFFSSNQYHTGYPMTMDSIVLTGGGAITTGLDQAISEYLNVPTVIGNPFMRMSNSPRVNRHILLRDAPLFTVACGLALRSFD